MHPKFKHWLTEQKYAPYKHHWYTIRVWMIYKVKKSITIGRHSLKYSWGDIINDYYIGDE